MNQMHRQQLDPLLLTDDLLLQGHWGKETRRAQRTSFNTLDNWGHKTPTQSKKRKDRKEKIKGSWPGTIHSVTLLFILLLSCYDCMTPSGGIPRPQRLPAAHQAGSDEKCLLRKSKIILNTMWCQSGWLPVVFIVILRRLWQCRRNRLSLYAFCRGY